MNYRDDDGTPNYGRPNIGPRAEDLPEPIPHLRERIEAEKAKRTIKESAA